MNAGTAVRTGAGAEADGRAPVRGRRRAQVATLGYAVVLVVCTLFSLTWLTLGSIAWDVGSPRAIAATRPRAQLSPLAAAAARPSATGGTFAATAAMEPRVSQVSEKRVQTSSTTA